MPQLPLPGWFIPREDSVLVRTTVPIVAGTCVQLDTDSIGVVPARFDRRIIGVVVGTQVGNQVRVALTGWRD